MILEHTITHFEDGTELLAVLKRTLSLSATTVKRLKRENGIAVDGRPVFTNYTVRQGERLTITLSEPPSDIVPETGAIDILYEDEGLLAVNKPPGLLVHPSRARNTGTLSNFVLEYLIRQGNGPYCHTVNRLDRDTSGAVLFAKNAHIKNLTAQALRSPEGKKEYVALLCGIPERSRGTIDMPIRRFRERDMRRIVAQDGDRAVTGYTVTASGCYNGQTVSLVRFHLITGRTHQIRVHCHWMGTPVLGDTLYFTPESASVSRKLGAGQQMLHSEVIELIHPITSLLLRVKAPITRPLMISAAKEIWHSGEF